jgi:hypothetical protein
MGFGQELKKPYEVYALSEPLACCLVVRPELGFGVKLQDLEIRTTGENTERVQLTFEVKRLRQGEG